MCAHSHTDKSSLQNPLKRIILAVCTVLELAQGDPENMGNRAMLDSYHRRRHWEVQARVIGIDALNRASMIGAPGLRDLRAGALNALYSMAPLRKTLMRAGLGVR